MNLAITVLTGDDSSTRHYSRDLAIDATPLDPYPRIDPSVDLAFTEELLPCQPQEPEPRPRSTDASSSASPQPPPAAAVAFPAIVPASALGALAAVAPSDRIALGVIGFGPRCKYDLTAMLKDPEARFVAVCDVQAGRREAGKQLVDEHYGN